MTENRATPPELDDLVGDVRDLAHRRARPRLSAEQVRRAGLRRRRTRRGAAAVGTGALAVAGAVIAVLLGAGHAPIPTTVIPPAVGHPTPATSAARRVAEPTASPDGTAQPASATATFAPTGTHAASPNGIG